MELANYFKIKNASKIIDHVQEVVYSWKNFDKQCKVNTDTKNEIERVIGNKKY